MRKPVHHDLYSSKWPFAWSTLVPSSLVRKSSFELLGGGRQGCSSIWIFGFSGPQVGDCPIHLVGLAGRCQINGTHSTLQLLSEMGFRDVLAMKELEAANQEVLPSRVGCELTFGHQIAKIAHHVANTHNDQQFVVFPFVSWLSEQINANSWLEWQCRKTLQVN